MIKKRAKRADRGRAKARLIKVASFFLPLKCEGASTVRISPLTVAMGVCFIVIGRTAEFFIAITAVILHECAHAYVAAKRGYRLDEFVLMPYGASLYGAFEGVSSNDEIAIAVAGPAFNLISSACCVAIWWIFPTAYAFTSEFAFCSLSVGALNLLPVFPLDGGRVALALASQKVARSRAYKGMRIASVAMCVVLIAAFVATAFYSVNLTFLCMGVFFLTGALFPDKRCKYSGLYDRAYRLERLRRGAAVAEYAVTIDEKLIDMYKILRPDKFTVFSVIDDAFDIKARVTEAQLVELCKTCCMADSVGDALKLK